MKVYGLTGLPGCGKSELGRIATENGYPLVRMGDMVWDHVKVLGLELTPENVGRTAHERRQEEGADIWARASADHIRKMMKETMGNGNEPEILVIDGVRSLEETERFRKEFKDFRIVAVHSSPRTRYERIMARKRVDDSLSFEAFQEREKRELGWGIATVVALADIMIVNEGSLEQLRMVVEELFS